MARLFISYGMTKSASTFAWQLIKRIAIAGGLPVATLTVVSKGNNAPEDYIDPISAEKLALIEKEAGDRPVVIKTHGAVTPPVVQLVAEGTAKAFASYRDLRDIALSLVDHGARSRQRGIKDFAEIGSVEESFPLLGQQVARFDSWTVSCQPLLLPYDEICFDTVGCVRRIADAIGVAVDAARIIEAFSADRSLIGQFNKGERSRHRNEMDAASSSAILDQFRSYYLKYYPEEVQPRRTASAARTAGSLLLNDTSSGEPHVRPTQEEVDRFRWFHSIDFGEGVMSKGAKSRSLLVEQADVVFKHDVAGKSVLDIGAWDGGFSFEAEKRGASRVLATDHFCWVGPGWGKKAAFDFAKKSLGSKVEERISDVDGLTPQMVGVFDTVLFLGVLYHLKEPFHALEHVARLTRGLLVVDTETAFDNIEEPVMRFFPGAEMNKDATNWWAPNRSCVTAMLRVAGFREVEASPNPVWDGKPNNRLGGRYIFHAWK